MTSPVTVSSANNQLCKSSTLQPRHLVYPALRQVWRRTWRAWWQLDVTTRHTHEKTHCIVGVPGYEGPVSLWLPLIFLCSRLEALKWVFLLLTGSSTRHTHAHKLTQLHRCIHACSKVEHQFPPYFGYCICEDTLDLHLFACNEIQKQLLARLLGSCFSFNLSSTFLLHVLFLFRPSPNALLPWDETRRQLMVATCVCGVLSPVISHICTLLCQRAGSCWQIWASHFHNPHLQQTRHASEVCECRWGSQTVVEGFFPPCF